MDSPKMDFPKMDSQNKDSEQMDSEKNGFRKIDSEKMDSEKKWIPKQWIQKSGIQKKWFWGKTDITQTVDVPQCLSLASRLQLIIPLWNWPEAFKFCIGFFCLSYMHVRNVDLVWSLQPSSHILLLGRDWLHQPPNKIRTICPRKTHGTMGWEGREPSSVFRRSERLDGRNWLLTVARSIVLAISEFVYRQSNEEQDGQNEIMGKMQQFRGPLIQTRLRLPLIFEDTPQGSGTSRRNCPDIPGSLLRNQRINKLSREGTNFSTTTSSSGRPPPTQRSPYPKVNLCARFFWPERIWQGVRNEKGNPQKNKGRTRLVPANSKVGRKWGRTLPSTQVKSLALKGLGEPGAEIGRQMSTTTHYWRWHIGARHLSKTVLVIVFRRNYQRLLRNDYQLSGSYRSTRVASDLASRALASQAQPQPKSESQAFCIAQSWIGRS